MGIGFHALCARFSLPGMVKHHDQTLDVHTMITHKASFGLFPFYPFRFVSFLLPSKPRTILSHPCYILVIFVMAPVVRLEPNGSQALLYHDDAVEDLKSQGWDAFIKRFEGYNLHVAKEFAQTFDGCRRKLEISS
jgi:hypothetical protein